MSGAEVLFRTTGNPFVDSGLAAMCVLAEKGRPEGLTYDDIGAMIPQLVDLYTTDGWRRALHGQVFPNAPVCNPSTRDRKKKYREQLQRLLEEVSPPSAFPSCTICGARPGVPVDKTRVPLLGSQSLVNFFPAQPFASRSQAGERVCANCLLAIQFSPLAMEKVGDLLIPHTAHWPLQLALARRTVEQAKRQAAANEYGVATFDYTRAAALNAAYDAIVSIMQHRYVEVEFVRTGCPPVRFYLFTNYGQGPRLSFYDIPSTVIEFLAEVQLHRDRDMWRRIVCRGNPPFRPKQGANVDEDEVLKKRENRLYRALTEGRSIVRYFFGEGREVLGTWNLLSLYLRKVRRMEKKRIDTIRDLADRFLELCKETGSARPIVRLDTARTYGDFRSVLLKADRDAVKRSGKALLTFDEYVIDLAPEGGRDWREIRDLLLFRIYEQGAEWLRERAEEVAGPDSESEGQ